MWALGPYGFVTDDPALARLSEVIATKFEPLPERVGLAGVILTGSGLGALGGALLASARDLDADGRRKHTETGALIGAAAAVAMSFLLYMHQEVLWN